MLNYCDKYFMLPYSYAVLLLQIMYDIQKYKVNMYRKRETKKSGTDRPTLFPSFLLVGFDRLI